MYKFASERGTFETQGALIAYEVAGSGSAVLLIHAGIADQSMWNDHFALLAQKYRVIRFDIPGYGQSRLPNGPIAFYDLPLALLQKFNIEEAHLVGCSYGASIAVDFAFSHPEYVKTLTLVGASISGNAPSADILAFGEQEEALLAAGNIAEATELNMTFWVDGPSRKREEVDPIVREKLYNMQFHAFRLPDPEKSEMISLDPPAYQRLKKLDIPTFLLVGDKDRPEKIALTAELAETLPNATQYIIPDAAHIPSMEQPDLFNELLFQFLASQDESEATDAIAIENGDSIVE